MILSYQGLADSRRQKIKARITTEHSASSYGVPVIVLPDGGAMDLQSWVLLDYRVERASKAERAGLVKMGLGDWA